MSSGGSEEGCRNVRIFRNSFEISLNILIKDSMLLKLCGKYR